MGNLPKAGSIRVALVTNKIACIWYCGTQNETSVFLSLRYISKDLYNGVHQAALYNADVGFLL